MAFRPLYLAVPTALVAAAGLAWMTSASAFNGGFEDAPQVAQAMYIQLVNTDVVIGGSYNPSLLISLDQVYFKELAIKKSPKDLIYQTVKWEATYSLADSEMLNLVLQNGKSSSY